MPRIDAHTHSRLDLATVAVFAVGPWALAFQGQPRALAYVLAIVHLAMTALTRFARTPISRSSYSSTVVSNSRLGPTLLVVGLVAPWSVTDRGFFAVAGVVILTVWALTKYR